MSSKLQSIISGEMVGRMGGGGGEWWGGMGEGSGGGLNRTFKCLLVMSVPLKFITIILIQYSKIQL